VLFLLEDFFLERVVNGNLIAEFADLMTRDEKVKHIGLTHFGSAGPFSTTVDTRLWKIARSSRYRISTQAGLWRVDTLRSYLRPEENAWMFEIFGTWRARRRNDLFLTANRELYCPGGSPIIEYAHTGIVKGEWNPAMRLLFDRHGIKVDFTRRGFSSGQASKMRTLMKLASSPAILIRALVNR
jgi:hypothetical protein